MLDFGFDRLVSCTCMHVSPAHVSNVDLFVFLELTPLDLIRVISEF